MHHPFGDDGLRRPRLRATVRRPGCPHRQDPQPGIDVDVPLDHGEEAPVRRRRGIHELDELVQGIGVLHGLADAVELPRGGVRVVLPVAA